MAQMKGEGFSQGLWRNMRRDWRKAGNEHNEAVLSPTLCKALSGEDLSHLFFPQPLLCGKRWWVGYITPSVLILWCCVTLQYPGNPLGDDVLDLGKTGMVVFGTRDNPKPGQAMHQPLPCSRDDHRPEILHQLEAHSTSSSLLPVRS